MGSDWPTDPLLPEKLNISQLFDTGNRADRTDGPTMHFERAPCKVNEIRQRMRAVWTRRKWCCSHRAEQAADYETEWQTCAYMHLWSCSRAPGAHTHTHLQKLYHEVTSCELADHWSLASRKIPHVNKMNEIKKAHSHVHTCTLLQ